MDRTLVACSLLVAIFGTSRLFLNNKPGNQVVDGGGSEMSSLISPTGPRRFFYYDGSRYAYISEEGSKEVNSLKLGKKLDVLKIDLNQYGDDFKEENLMTTFLPGGEIYEIETYNKEFRLAVVFDGEVYLAEKIDNMDASDVDLEDYFKKADLVERTKDISIFDHMGLEELKKIDKETSDDFIGKIKTAKEYRPTDEEYEKIGGYQSDGKSFKLIFNFEDKLNLVAYMAYYFKQDKFKFMKFSLKNIYFMV